ncbi:hypothetical protein D9613_008008 [Agrocybe pediades]|uniref:Uncharacterized protein n=1 Tax=Agrocybe pediades TaxID=84607 RepID=A0A8H4QNE0_9AGAR|nr:hypothetical protein D9613_008008 [Agrocybe pediades]
MLARDGPLRYKDEGIGEMIRRIFAMSSQKDDAEDDDDEETRTGERARRRTKDANDENSQYMHLPQKERKKKNREGEVEAPTSQRKPPFTPTTRFLHTLDSSSPLPPGRSSVHGHPIPNVPTHQTTHADRKRKYRGFSQSILSNPIPTKTSQRLSPKRKPNENLVCNSNPPCPPKKTRPGTPNPRPTQKQHTRTKTKNLFVAKNRFLTSSHTTLSRSSLVASHIVKKTSRRFEGGLADPGSEYAW